ncbi:hypothetical protein [Glutamicibacter arilaitensis]|uniref:hypothetical protein n=1 Tax=Glutamicibacter arilaitensis TaxID=256701 RepID=UPI003FD09937
MNDVMDSLIKIIPPLATLATVIVGWAQSQGKLRATLKDDAEILTLLPEGEARTKLASYIAERVEHLKKTDSGTRDIPIFVVAVVSTVLFGYLTIWLWGLEQWWTYALAVAAGSFFLIFLYGVFETAQKKDRTGEKKTKNNR